MKRRFIVTPCSWCRGDHYLVVRNVESSRPLRALGSFNTAEAAQAFADDLVRRAALRRAIRNLALAATEH